mgnify:CR=1 FL=1
MSDDAGDAPTMAERLNATGSKLAELSKKANIMFIMNDCMLRQHQILN